MKVKCSYCGSEVDSSAKYCPNCGSKIVEEAYKENEDVHYNIGNSFSKKYDEEVRAKRKKKAAIYGIVALVSLFILIINGAIGLTLDDIGIGALFITISIFTLLVTSIFSLVYLLGFTKSTVIEGHTITLDYANRTYVYLDGKCISCTYYANTVYVNLPSGTRIAVIPKHDFGGRYNRVYDVDFVKVCKE